MGSRSWLLVCVALGVLVLCPLGLMHWGSARLLAQLTPIGDVRWEGYVIEHQTPWRTNWGEDGHLIRVSRGDSLLLERHVAVTNDSFVAGPQGFFAGLNVDADPDVELVLCTHGDIESFFEPDSTGDVAVQPGRLVSRNARDLCSSVASYGARPQLRIVACCAVPIAVPAFIAILLLARRERREDERQGRSAFCVPALPTPPHPPDTP